MAEYGPLSHQTIAGKYQLGELLGQGGFGAVYIAHNLTIGRQQAVKVIIENRQDRQFRERFDREARTLGTLNHPNILHVDDYIVEGNRAYLVTPYIAGGTLRTVLQQQGRLTLESTGIFLRQISAALDYAHAQKVIHLDLKPPNLLHQDNTLYLSDFGLAHLMKEGSISGGSSLAFGTPHYMAPEHISGQPARSSDIYALGIILFQMLAGKVPFDGKDIGSIVVRHLQEPPPSLSARRPDIPRTIDSVINRAMAKRPQDRYSSAGALFNDFREKAALSLEPLPLTTPFRTKHLEDSRVPLSPPPSPFQNSTPVVRDTISLIPSEQLERNGRLQLDTPPPMDLINIILQGIGRNAQVNQGRHDEKT